MSLLRRLTLSIIAASALLALLVPGAGAAAKTTTQTAAGGAVKATLTFSGSPPKITNLRLKIARSGHLLYNRPVSSRFCGQRCDPGALGKGRSSLRVLDLEGSGQSDVILELFTGGADCCFVDQVFSFDPGTQTYVESEHNFLSPGATLKRLGSDWRFVSADGRFECEFTDCADSGAPLQIWAFAARKFADVTRHYPKLIGSDAARWLRLYKHHVTDGVGLIAAWAADEELLGQNRLVQSTLKAAAAKRALRDGGLGQATGKRFIGQLNRFLHKLKYEG